jgi:hypothetical protein
MIARLRAWAHAWLIALDQLAFVWLAGWFYLIDRAAPPSPYETISSYTGRMANAGMGWALWLQPIIDRLFMLLGSKPRHCQRSIVSAQVRAAWLDAAPPER